MIKELLIGPRQPSHVKDLLRPVGLAGWQVDGLADRLTVWRVDGFFWRWDLMRSSRIPRRTSVLAVHVRAT